VIKIVVNYARMNFIQTEDIATSNLVDSQKDRSSFKQQ